MATPASAILIVLPQDCGSAGGELGFQRGASEARGRGAGREKVKLIPGRQHGSSGAEETRVRARAGRTLARFSSRFSPGNGGGGIHRDSSVSGPPDTRARTTTQVARPEARWAAIRLPPSRRDLHGARAPEKAVTPRSSRQRLTGVARSVNERSLEMRTRPCAAPRVRFDAPGALDHCAARRCSFPGLFPRKFLRVELSAECDELFRYERGREGRSLGGARSTTRETETVDGSGRTPVYARASVRPDISRRTRSPGPKPAAKFRRVSSSTPKSPVRPQHTGAFCLHVALVTCRDICI